MEKWQGTFAFFSPDSEEEKRAIITGLFEANTPVIDISDTLLERAECKLRIPDDWDSFEEGLEQIS